MGRDKEARFILGRLRGEEGEDEARAEAEFQDIINIVQLERSTSKQNTYWRMLFDFGNLSSGSLHTGRRVQLVIWLQIIQEWCGIAGITVYAPTIFGIAGYDAQKSGWLSGLNDTTYMFATIACVYTLDVIGRRYVSSLGLCIDDANRRKDGLFTGELPHKRCPCFWSEASQEEPSMQATAATQSSRQAMEPLQPASRSFTRPSLVLPG